LTSDRKRPIDVLQMSKHSKKYVLDENTHTHTHQIDVSVMWVCYQGCFSDVQSAFPLSSFFNLHEQM